MKIATEQINLANALRAVADGGQVQAIWVDEDGTINFYSLNENIGNITKIADAFLLVAEADPVDTVDDLVENPDDENTEKIAGSQQNLVENCETAAKTAPPKEPRKKLDDGKITALFRAGWSTEKIADEIGASKQAVYAHLRNLREEGRL